MRRRQRLSLLRAASIVLTSLLPWKALSEARHQNNNPGDEPPSSSYQHQSFSSRKLIPPTSSPGYPFGTAGVPKENLEGGSRRQPNAYSEGDDEEENTRQQSPPYYDSFDQPEIDKDDNDVPIKRRRRRRISIGNRTNKQTQQQAIPPLPMVYRYYSRQKTRNVNAGSVPFLLLGPNVDHWKVTAQQLSARGFNVIAVASSSTGSSRRPAEGPSLVVQLLDALRWNKVLVVGCDNEAVLAIQTALQLSPSKRIAGLILCGDLEESERMAMASLYQRKHAVTLFSLDEYLYERLTCPFTIIWNGDATPRAVAGDELDSSSDTTTSRSSWRNMRNHRTVIIGGGSAPHRRRPEIFAWVLTRFVEDKIAPPVLVEPAIQPLSRQQRSSESATSSHLSDDGTHLPWRVDEVFNEESFVVFGRVVATALFYGMALKVLLYQYDNVRDGVDSVASFKRNSVVAVKNSVTKILSLFLVFRRRSRFLLDDSESIEEDGDVAEPSSGEEEVEGETDSPNEEEEGEKDSEMQDERDGDKPQDERDPQPEKQKKKTIFYLDHRVA